MAAAEQPQGLTAASNEQAVNSGGFQQPATSFEPPSPTQQGTQTFAWGLANAGAAPPNSPFLFAASQAAALDQPALAPPPAMASLDAVGGIDPHVNSPSSADASSVQPHPSIGSLSNASVVNGGGGPTSGGAGGAAGLSQQFLPTGGGIADAHQQQAAAQLAGQQLLQQQAAAAQQQQQQQQLAQPHVQMVINPATGLPVPVAVPAAMSPPPPLHHSGASDSGGQQQRLAPAGNSDVAQLMQQHLASASQPPTSGHLAATMQQQIAMAAQQQQQNQLSNEQLAGSLQAHIAANEQLNVSLAQQQVAQAQQLNMSGSPPTHGPSVSMMLGGLGAIPSVSFPMHAMPASAPMAQMAAAQAAVSQQQANQQLHVAQLALQQQQQQAAQVAIGQQLLHQHQQQQQHQHQHQQQQQQQQQAAQAAAINQQRQQQHLTASQLDRVNRIAQASLAQGSQPGSATSSIKANSIPSPPGSLVGDGSTVGGGSMLGAASVLGAAGLPQMGAVPAAPGLPPVGGLPGYGGLTSAAAGLPPAGGMSAGLSFPGFTALSQPIPLMGGAANLGIGVGMPPQPLSAGLTPGAMALQQQQQQQQQQDLASLIAHFERSLVAAAGGVSTPALLAQAQTAARQHLASQQLALQFAAAQAPMPGYMGALGGVDPMAAALAAAGGGMGGGLLSAPAPSLASSIAGSDLGSLVGGATVPAPTVPPVTRPRVGKVKMVISAGGYFIKKNDAWDYQGGETRLVSIPAAAKFQDLVDSLDRVASGSITSASSIGLSQVSAMKFQLPSDPSVYVDVVDDEDVSLMLDEWREASAAAAPGTNPSRLHIFVQWRDTAAPSTACLSNELESLHTSRHHSAESHEPRSRHHSAGSVGGASTTSVTAASPRPQGFEALADRMEVIRPDEIQLVKFLGAGGYGEVYLGKWHGCDAAIKCLNPGLFFGGGDFQNHAAVADLVKEADILGRCITSQFPPDDPPIELHTTGVPPLSSHKRTCYTCSLRHPNVVFVYGVVLPPEPKEAGENGDSGEAQPGPPAPQGAGMVRPPAIVTEYMSGGSLRSALSRRLEGVQGALTRLLIALDAAKGMEYLHNKGIVHFDMKSANLLLGHRDRRVICKVADFGLSKQKQQTYVSGVSSSRGTLPWIAPEIIKHPEAVNEKVDVYSYGIVLWELWTGREPFEGLNYHALLHQMTSAGEAMRPPLPGSADWDAAQVLTAAEPAPGYRALLERCWNEKPSRRPSFEEIVKELQSMAAALRGKMPRRRNPSSSTAGSSQAGSQAAAPPAAPQPAPQPPPQQPPDAPAAAAPGKDAEQVPAAAASPPADSPDAAPSATEQRAAAPEAAGPAASAPPAGPAAGETADTPAAATPPSETSDGQSVYSAFAAEASQSQPSA